MVRAVFEAEDGYAAPSVPDTAVAKARMFEYFGVESLSDMLSPMYGEFDKARFAGFTISVAAAAESGRDELCLLAFEQAGEQLGRHITAILPKVAPALLDSGLTVVCEGSVWKSWPLLKAG